MYSCAVLNCDMRQASGSCPVLSGDVRRGRIEQAAGTTLLAGVPRLGDRMCRLLPNRQGLFRAGQWRVSPATSDLGPRTSELRSRNPEPDAGLRTPDCGRRTPAAGRRLPDVGAGPRTPAPKRQPPETRMWISDPSTWTAVIDGGPQGLGRRLPCPRRLNSKLEPVISEWELLVRFFWPLPIVGTCRIGEQVTTTNAVPPKGGCDRWFASDSQSSAATV